MATQVSHRGSSSKDVAESGKVRTTRDTVWRSIPTNRSAPKARDAERPSRAARIERAEDALIEQIFENHPNRQRAMDRLLDDIDNGESSTTEPTPRVTMSQVQRIERIETLLLAATIEHHPKSHQALESLLDDVIGDAPTLPPEFYDRDWDGLA